MVSRDPSALSQWDGLESLNSLSRRSCFAKEKRRSAPVPPSRPVPAAPTKPGLFAPKGAKQLFKAVRAQDVQAIRRVGEEHSDFRLPAYSMASIMLATSEAAEAKRLADEAFAIGRDPAEDPFVSKYLHTKVTLKIAPGVVAEIPLNRDALGLLLAELRQDGGDVEGAIDVVEQLEPTSYSAVSLAELYGALDRWDDVIELTEGLANEDDLTELLCVYRGVAMRERGYLDASLEAFKEALRFRSRAEDIRKLALSERATTYEAHGKKGMARKDLERVLAMDSHFEGVRDRLQALNQ
jgi:tetratricopeptide (TPR) repeat protein